MDTPSGANAVSRRKGYLQLPSQAQSRKGVCTLSHKKRAYGRGKAVHCAKNEGFLLPNGGKRAIL